MAKLVVRAGRNIGTEYKLNADRLIMGRRSACPIPILDPKSSREHAVITRKNDAFFIQDLSRNGTYVNNAPASNNGAGPTPLNFGDQIKIGETQLEMVDEKNEPIAIEIPGYKILEKIGVGGMGVVYKAKQLSMDRVVALKVLNEKYSSDREFVDRFIREARAAGKLNHPNVIHVHDVSKANGRHYFSMEFIDGNSVKEMLRVQGTVDLKKALDIVVQTAKALEFAHENQIVHRDIKPDNIMLSKDGVVKIADLGIAKTFEETGPAAKENRRVMGTPHYMAPEQALGKEIDHRVDVYSLGATFYHMVTGTTPFTGSTAHEVLKAHIQESLPPIQEFSPNVPDPVCFIVERMMAKLPEKRYANMTRLIEDLERAQQGISEGIERIPAGDSTILRAVGAEAAAAGARKRKKALGTQDVRTGLQTPVRKALFSLALVVLFLLALGLVVHFARPAVDAPDSGSQPSTPLPSPAPDPGTASQPGAAVSQSNTQAAKRLAEAKGLLDADPVSTAAEAILNEIVRAFPASTSCDEARKSLAEIAGRRQDAERKKALAAFEEAKKFEGEHRDDPARFLEIAQKFRAVQAMAQSAADLAKDAQNRAEAWQKRNSAEVESSFRTALNVAQAEADAALLKKDFDAARRVLKDFLAKAGNAPLKAAAEAKLLAVDAEAGREFQAAQQEAQRKLLDGSRPLPLTMAVWDAYLKECRDAEHRAKAEEARKELDAQAAKYIQDVGNKIAALVKVYDYEAAILATRTVQQRLVGFPLANLAKDREQELLLQRDLHLKVLKAIEERVKAGPVPLPFKIEIPKMTDIDQWAITSAAADKITLSKHPPPGPGVTKKFGDLPISGQYQIYLLFLPSPEAADHKALAAFCRERGLNDEAAVEEKRAAPAP